MTNQNIVNWLKAKTEIGDGIAVGTIDESKPRFIGVYDPRSTNKQRICIGGKSATKYQIKKAVILIHWTNNPTEAEAKAREVSELLHGLTDIDMDGVKVIASDASHPVWAGRDVKGVCEYVVNVKIEYERNDQ